MDDEERQPASFKALPMGPQSDRPPVRQFQRHRVLSDAQFGTVTVPEPIRRSTPEGLGQNWQGR